MNYIFLLVLFLIGEIVAVRAFVHNDCGISRLPASKNVGHSRSSQLRLGIETKADYDNFQKVGGNILLVISIIT